MPTSLSDELPDVLREVRTTPLFVMRLDVRPLQIIGATPSAYRRVGVVPSGVFAGEHLSGQVLDGGTDWQNVRSDGGTTLDARLVFKTADDALIGMSYPRHPQRTARCHRPRREGRGGQCGRILLPHCTALRDRCPAICLVERRRRYRHRPSPCRWASLRYSCRSLILPQRRLCEEIALNLAYRWFCRLGLEDGMPDHSTFSKTRHGRFRDSVAFRGPKPKETLNARASNLRLW